MQSQYRKEMFPKTINVDILNKIQSLLERNNPYVSIYQQAGKLVEKNPESQLNIVIKADVRTDRTKNKPTCNEIAVLMVEDDQATTGKRDVIIRAKSADARYPFQFINDSLSMYDPLAYPLLHMHGEQGWQFSHYPKRNNDILIKQYLARDNSINFNNLFYSRINQDNSNSQTSNTTKLLSSFF